jgi:hypothetical protein
MGSPKVGNNYGDRRIVVPGCLVTYDPMKVRGRGRILGYLLEQTLQLTHMCGVRSYSNGAENISTVKSDVVSKLMKLAAWCRDNPKEIVTFPIYRFLLQERLYEIAYHKLRSNPGNMTPGIVPTTLDGMSPEVIQKIIESLRDESFRFTPGRRVQIPKPSGGSIPLTVAPPSDGEQRSSSAL